VPETKEERERMNRERKEAKATRLAAQLGCRFVPDVPETAVV
jgi:hypothetical protein